MDDSARPRDKGGEISCPADNLIRWNVATKHLDALDAVLQRHYARAPLQERPERRSSILAIIGLDREHHHVDGTYLLRAFACVHLGKNDIA
jgi:hypothetical protein